MEISLNESTGAGQVSCVQPVPDASPSSSGRQGVSGRSLKVVFREFSDVPGGVAALESILQSFYDAASRIARNMVATPEERRVLEERLKRLEKLREAVKERKIDEQEARLELNRIMEAEDKRAELDSIIQEQVV